MAYIAFDNIWRLTLKFTVVFVSLSLCAAQPILNNNNDSSQEDVLFDVTAANVGKEQRRTKAGSALVQLVEDNDDARRKWFLRREQTLHDSRNGANGHFVKGKDNNEADASAIPPSNNAPVATPEQLLALLKKRPGFGSDNIANRRVIRQTVHPGFQGAHFASVYPNTAAFASPYALQPQPNPYTSPAPPSTSAPATTTTEAAPAAPTVNKSVQDARDEYRKSRFEGSFYALALKLSKAGNTPLSEGGSYSG
jgi:hypothetical protein